MNKKTIYYIFGTIISAIIIGLGGYFLLFNKGGDIVEQKTNGNPFGNINNNQSGTKGVTNQPNQPSNGDTMSFSDGGNVIIWKIYDKPISGATIIQNGSTTLIRFVDTATGNVYEQNEISKNTIRISNTTIPKSNEIAWGNGGNSILFRYEDNGTIKTFYGKIAATSSADSSLVGGKLLENNISEVAVSPSGNKIFYSQDLADDGIIAISNFDGSEKYNIFASRLKEWLVSWPNDNTLVAISKPSANIDGYLYFVNQKTKKLEKVLGPVSGLTAKVEGSGENLIYSESANNTFSLNLFSKVNQNKSSLYLKTLPEKCVWDPKKSYIIYCGVPKNVPKAQYPDAWYQGLISFSDNLWIYDTGTGAGEILSDFEKITGEEIDVTNPNINISGNLLIFTNKKDSSLWGLSIKNEALPQLGD